MSMTESYEFDFGGDSIDDTLKNAPKSQFDPIEAGWYEAMLTRIEVRKPAPGKTATTLSLTFKITSGKYMNRLIFANVTASGGTDKQMQWSRVLMGKFAKNGHGYSGDSTKFDPGAYLYKPVGIKVGVQKPRTEKDGTERPARNQVNEFKPASAVAPGAPPPANTWSKPAPSASAAPAPQAQAQHDNSEPDEAPEMETTIARGGRKPWE